MKFQKIILIIVALIATNLSAFEPFTLSFTDRAASNKPNASAIIDVQLTLVNRYTGANIGGTTPTYQHTATAVKTNAYGMFSVVFEPEAWKTANFETPEFQNGYNNYALRIETKTATTEYKQIGVLAIGNLINNTVVTEAISGPAKSNFKITINEGKNFSIPNSDGTNLVSFAVTGFTPETLVKPIPCEGYSISITEYKATTGVGTAKITAIAGSTNEKPELILFAENGQGKTTLASQDFLAAYYGPASGLAESTTEYQANRAKPVWIVTDGGEIDGTNDIKTALNGLPPASRQLELPNATSIGNEAFGFCNALTSVSLPKAENIGDEAFTYSERLTTVSLPAATSIGANAFHTCTGLTSIFLPSVREIGNYVFCACSSLSSASLPKATIIGRNLFSSCASLSSVSLPLVTSIGDYTLAGCTALTSVTFGSKITSWGSNVFAGTTIPGNITLTFKTEQKTFSGSDYPGPWTITNDNLAGHPNKEFVGKTFKEIILK